MKIINILIRLFKNGILVNTSFKNEPLQSRTINPKMGHFGFLGFLGFIGFLLEGIVAPFPFFFFAFFSFFGFYYEGKMSNTLIDERFKINAYRAEVISNKIALNAIILVAIIVLAREFIVSGYRLIAVEKGGKVISASIWGKLKTVTQMIGIIFAFLDKFNFGEFIFRVSTQAEAQINSASIYMTTGQYIINIITTIVLILSVIATIFSGINYLKDGKDLFKD